MYIIFQKNFKQYLVKVGSYLKVDRLKNKINSLVEFNQILSIYDKKIIKIGDPFVPHAKVIVKVISHLQGKKIKIIKFRRRKHSKKKQGHRQKFTLIKIEKISF
ncbi:50S ribosomal protein L21 [Candidatus Riesia pediculicola]|uniref:Large ribosomal subunit protein bL21 n=1 Tax=Riesia pediculicola (strain USDA) TaxID=515618 RepID=D4G878_RIEPU|nr:50S ribosomal protein L21 [Candidatus Riesia pediculicola]ADD79801.1 ribosomal protein L21 [Candidatus Riesia pediculicola USDA]ARC53778.1 50S ribosomal protein L21 [Candidatus Riesia pediculicola]QOJ86416.1 50S ribosomal protein L21 [Candidatus Riesia pediculicola]